MQETIVATGARVEGNVSGQLVRVFGQVTGMIDAHEVIIEAGAQVGSGIIASGVRVLGRVEGQIRAERVVVESSGQSLGGISAPSVSLAEGCTIQGRLDSNLPSPAAGAPKHTQPPQPLPATAYTRPGHGAPAHQPSHTPQAYASAIPASKPIAPRSTVTPPAAALPVTASPTSPPKPAPKTAPRAFSLDGVRLSAKDG